MIEQRHGEAHVAPVAVVPGASPHGGLTAERLDPPPHLLGRRAYDTRADARPQGE
ncbi:hypothetical protein ACH4D3_13640 [Streptomyces sp. NPDC018026]|uniref:hypothetical protein n=1 Tax=Streptomyces sp. NPDC018026 TaxID=3365031 RepID=UPI00379D7A2A